MSNFLKLLISDDSEFVSMDASKTTYGIPGFRIVEPPYIVRL